MSAFLKGASPSFQKYIEEGLAEIQRTLPNAADGISMTQFSDNRMGKLIHTDIL